ncbi:hypothetical protein E3O55_01045 [Cryobacterium sp. MDB1-18-2]|uniref:RICIN domain-containing protein n=1 Tax=unclassified Cryobacterium TaxID=2649013 RepID=UPI00106C26E0|nr:MULTISPECIES: RICIN domain-containing protein [unclassified Cryobacterium]TFC36044.1 hypothetical protein E3O55_01045 [Cryobacterium sp. MDB1-18-2]TFC41665.1 hypothetical protein E3O50_11490 [Cryobacterium sp. MDB1-18-1]
MSTVQRRAPRIRSPKRMLALAFTLFLTLAGTSVAQASWTAPGVTAIASVTAGSLAVTQTGFDTLAVLYDSSTLSVTKVVTVTNKGNIPAPYTLTLTAPATTLATGVDLQTWPVASAASCSTGATSTSPTGQHWTSALTFSGSGATALAVGTSAYFCVRSTITQAQRFALVGISAVPTVTLASSVGNWAIAPLAIYATQTVANTLTPGAPTATTTDHTATLTWAKPADTAAIITYQVFRNGTLIGTTTAPTVTYTDTGLDVGTAYSYTVRALDAAGDASPLSTAAVIATAGPNSGAWYKVKNATTGLCIDGENQSTAAGTAMISFGCKSTGFDNQSWNFSNPAGVSAVKAKYAPQLFWDTGRGAAAGLAAQLQNAGTSNQSWRITAVGAVGSGTYRFVNDSGQCLDVSGQTTATNNIQLEQQPCGVLGLASQTFTMTWVG